jgi:hypothetical protein
MAQNGNTLCICFYVKYMKLSSSFGHICSQSIYFKIFGWDTCKKNMCIYVEKFKSQLKHEVKLVFGCFTIVKSMFKIIKGSSLYRCQEPKLQLGIFMIHSNSELEYTLNFVSS